MRIERVDLLDIQLIIKTVARTQPYKGCWLV